MKKKKSKRKPQAQPCGEKPCAGKFARTCCRAAIIATSYQVFSLGVGTVMDHPQLLLRREQGKTIIERVASSVSSSLDEPAYGWCLCAHLGQRGPGGGGCSCTGFTGCTVCMGGTGCTGCTGGTGCTGCTGYTAEQQRQDDEQKKRQEEERQRQALEEQRKEIERKQTQEFEESKQRALEQFKGAGSGEFDLKGLDSNELGLKGIETANEPRLKEGTSGLKDINTDTSVVDLRDKKKPYALDLSVVKGATPQLRTELLGNFPDMVSLRTSGANEQAQEILRSFKTGQPPSPVKNIRDLAPGDVILVAPVPLKARIKDETMSHLKDVMESNGVNFLDRWGSNNWTSPASHAAIFLGKRNGKNWYLDNTSVGPVIKDEKEFLKNYGQRQMDVATLVGQPLSRHEGQELWKGAHELRNTTSYGLKFFPRDGNDVMVCSEASRWLLLRAGRRVPETMSENAKIGGIDTGLNKKQFVSFSPSDFYEEQQYFVIHQLGMRP